VTTPLEPEVDLDDVRPPSQPLTDFVQRNPIGALVGAMVIGVLLGKWCRI
jgi:hypothetical protein